MLRNSAMPGSLTPTLYLSSIYLTRSQPLQPSYAASMTTRGPKRSTNSGSNAWQRSGRGRDVVARALPRRRAITHDAVAFNLSLIAPEIVARPRSGGPSVGPSCRSVHTYVACCIRRAVPGIQRILIAYLVSSNWRVASEAGPKIYMKQEAERGKRLAPHVRVGGPHRGRAVDAAAR